MPIAFRRNGGAFCAKAGGVRRGGGDFHQARGIFLGRFRARAASGEWGKFRGNRKTPRRSECSAASIAEYPWKQTANVPGTAIALAMGGRADWPQCTSEG